MTGASSGIGSVTARVLSQLGAKVIILGRNEARLQSTFRSLSGEGHGQYSFDLSALDEIPPLVKRIALEHGLLNGLFHAAGIAGIRSISIFKGKYIDSVFDASIKAALMLAKGFCQKGVYEPDKASLVFMSSAAGLRGAPGMGIYSASKAAIDAAVRSLACELANRSFRVNSIIAGAVETEMHKNIINNLDKNAIFEYQKRHLLGFGKPEDIAFMVAYLMCDFSKWITGTNVIVDGGYCCS